MAVPVFANRYDAPAASVTSSSTVARFEGLPGVPAAQPWSCQPEISTGPAEPLRSSMNSSLPPTGPRALNSEMTISFCRRRLGGRGSGGHEEGEQDEQDGATEGGHGRDDSPDRRLRR